MDIKCKEISVSTDSRLSDLDIDWCAYDVIGEDDNQYLLILRRLDFDVTAILDEDCTRLWGILDNSIWPSHFAERENPNKLIDIRIGLNKQTSENKKASITCLFICIVK